MVNEKRKITQVSPNGPIAKKGRQGSKLNPAYTSKSTSDRHDSIKSSFAEHLFDDDTKRSYADQYASSEP